MARHAPDQANTVNPSLTVENSDYAAFVGRVIRAHGRRIAEGDVEGLVELEGLSRQVEGACRIAVHGLRRSGYSWAEIAARVGVTKQAAQQRWGRRS